MSAAHKIPITTERKNRLPAGPGTQDYRVRFGGSMMWRFTLALLASLLTAVTAAYADPPCGGWSNRAPASPPEARDSHAMAYDSDRGLTVLFGVLNTSYLDDTWEWNGTNWSQHSPTSKPLARYGHAMAYDSVRHVTVLFGGKNDDVSPYYFTDTWEWKGTNWTQRTPAAHPSARAYTAMAYDSARGVTVLFGGENLGYVGETWEWNGTNWSQRSPTNSPSARFGHTMAYDSSRGKTVLFGGGRRSVQSQRHLGVEWDQLVAAQPGGASVGAVQPSHVVRQRPRRVGAVWRQRRHQ